MNPFLAEEAVMLTPIRQDQQGDASLDNEGQVIMTDIAPVTLEVQTDIVV